MIKEEIKNGLIIDKFNNKQWYKDDLLHRDNNLPAIEYASGHKEWYQHGLLHRESGPSIEYENADKEWYQHGLLHREDGPAVESFGDKEWWINGQELNEEQFNHYVEMKRLNEELHQDLSVSSVKSIKLKL